MCHCKYVAFGEKVIIEPGQYTVAALDPLLQHPEVAGETENVSDISSILSAYVSLAEVAIRAHPDDTSFWEWETRLTDHLARLDPDLLEPPFANVDLALSLTELYLRGAAAGSLTAQDRLQERLASVTNGHAARMLTICGEDRIDPDPFMARIIDPDRAMTGWTGYLRGNSYMYTGEVRDPAEIMTPGLRTMTDYFIGKPPDQYEPTELTTFWFASNLLRVVPPAEKGQVIDRFSIAMDTVVTTPDAYQPEEMALVLEFGAQVQADPGVTRDKKDDLHTQIVSANTQFLSPNGRSARYHLARMIGQGAQPEQIMQIVERGQINDRIMLVTKGACLRLAIEAYVDMKQLDAAAELLPLIEDVDTWARAFKNYADHGGDVKWAQLVQDSVSIANTASDTQVRTQCIDLELAQQDTQQTEAAAQALHALVKGLIQNGETGNATANTIVLNSLRKFLRHTDDAGTHIEPAAITDMVTLSDFLYKVPILAEMTRFNVPTASQTMWEHIQGDHIDGTYLHHHGYYLDRYALGVLADSRASLRQ